MEVTSILLLFLFLKSLQAQGLSQVHNFAFVQSCSKLKTTQIIFEETPSPVRGRIGQIVTCPQVYQQDKR